MHKKSPHAYKNIPLDTVIILKNLITRTLYISLFILSCIFRLAQFLFVVLFCTALQQWQEPRASGTSLAGCSKYPRRIFNHDSNRSLPQVPYETLGLSNVRQNLSSSFNRLRRSITNHIGKHTSKPQHQAPIQVDAEQLSPTSLHTQLTAYQSTVRTSHEQNDCNAELLRHLEAAVMEKYTKIS